jgi:hypothetical protein
MKLNRLSTLAFAGLACTLALPAPAGAQEAVVATDRRVVTTPNRSLLHSGVVTLGASYIPAFIVAVESPRSFDRQLFIPVAGPWMDFATRKCSDCEHERLNKALLITDGIFQGIGALNILGAFLFPETRVYAKNTSYPASQQARLSLAPTRMAGGYGLTAVGSF